MAYAKVNWTETTPLDAVNLGQMDTGIADAHGDLSSHTGAANPHSGSASTTALNNHTGAANPHTGSASTTALNSHTGDSSSHVSIGGKALGTSPDSFADGVTVFSIESGGPFTGGRNEGVVVTHKHGAGRVAQVAYGMSFTDIPGQVWMRSHRTNTNAWGDWTRLDNL